MAQQSGRAFRDLLQGVRLNFSLVVVLLVTLSVSALGIVLLAANDEVVSVSSQEVAQIIDRDPNIGRVIQDNPEAIQDVVAIANIVRSDDQETIRALLSFYTPVFVIGSGIVAFITARYLIRPIRDSYSSQERFLQDAAHELRNPLGAMKVTVQSIKNKPSLTQKDMETVVNSIERQINRLIRINENLLFLDKQAVVATRDQKANISELLQDVIEDQQPNAVKQGVVVRQQIEDNIMLPIQPEDFVRIMRNVIENAIKYSSEVSDEIRVSLTKKGSRIRISVRDFGVGIPEQELHQIGERFYRGSNTSQFEGTGLGLAIVKKIVRANGGSITINSRQNEGTHILINF